MKQNDFNPPGTINVICDLSHHNVNVDLESAKSSGLIGLFNKATQSFGKNLYYDPTYSQRRTEAKQLGLLFGAYHFGTAGNGAVQADIFLDYSIPQNDTLLVLDFERVITYGESTMGITDAKDFVIRIKERTGKFPGIYGGELLKTALSKAADSLLSQCWLWVAQYPMTRNKLEPSLPNGWSNYKFWQYTDCKSPHCMLEPIDGIGLCDRDLFKGNEYNLSEFWKLNQV